MSNLKIPDLKSLQQVFAIMDANRKERFAKAFDSAYPDVAKWVRENGIPKVVMIPNGYVGNVEALQPLVTHLERDWGITIVKTPIIRTAQIFFIADDKIKIGVDLSDTNL